MIQNAERKNESFPIDRRFLILTQSVRFLSLSLSLGGLTDGQTEGLTNWLPTAPGVIVFEKKNLTIKTRKILDDEWPIGEVSLPVLKSIQFGELPTDTLAMAVFRNVPY